MKLTSSSPFCLYLVEKNKWLETANEAIRVEVIGNLLMLNSHPFLIPELVITIFFMKSTFGMFQQAILFDC